MAIDLRSIAIDRFLADTIAPPLLNKLRASQKAVAGALGAWEQARAQIDGNRNLTRDGKEVARGELALRVFNKLHAFRSHGSGWESEIRELEQQVEPKKLDYSVDQMVEYRRHLETMEGPNVLAEFRCASADGSDDLLVAAVESAPALIKKTWGITPAVEKQCRELRAVRESPEANAKLDELKAVHRAWSDLMKDALNRVRGDLPADDLLRAVARTGDTTEIDALTH